MRLNRTIKQEIDKLKEERVGWKPELLANFDFILEFAEKIENTKVEIIDIEVNGGYPTVIVQSFGTDIKVIVFNSCVVISSKYYNEKTYFKNAKLLSEFLLDLGNISATVSYHEKCSNMLLDDVLQKYEDRYNDYIFEIEKENERLKRIELTEQRRKASEDAAKKICKQCGLNPDGYHINDYGFKIHAHDYFILFFEYTGEKSGYFYLQSGKYCEIDNECECVEEYGIDDAREGCCHHCEHEITAGATVIVEDIFKRVNNKRALKQTLKKLKDQYEEKLKEYWPKEYEKYKLLQVK